MNFQMKENLQNIPCVVFALLDTETDKKLII